MRTILVAFVLLFVRTLYAQHLPYDFVVTQTDVNGWALNPKWGAQALTTNPHLPNPYQCPDQEPWAQGSCTSSYHYADKSDVKCPDTIFESVWFPGHINFGGAVITGTIFWSDHSGNDDDYNMLVVPDGGGGLTTTNPTSIRLEFDSDETIDHFHTSWWSDFHKAVDKGGQTPHAMVDGKRAIAFGVFGLDCAHDCSTEMHPVFALAIEVNSDPNDNVWAFFVRNWGNEGYCSSGEERLADSISTFAFTLTKPGATAVKADQIEALCRGEGGAGPSVGPVQNGSANVVFGFPKASKEERINGSMHLHWTGSPLRAAAGGLIRAAPVDTPGAEPEERVNGWLAKMSPQQRAVYAGARPLHATPELDGASTDQAARAVERHASGDPLVEAVADPVRDKNDLQELEAIKRAYGGTLPK